MHTNINKSIVLPKAILSSIVALYIEFSVSSYSILNIIIMHNFTYKSRKQSLSESFIKISESSKEVLVTEIQPS